MTLRASPRNRSPDFDLDGLADACCERMEEHYTARGLVASPLPSPILEITDEGEGIATLWVQVPSRIAADYRAGQYFMCWNPYDAEGGMDRLNYNNEKPYSVGDIKVDSSGIDHSISADTGNIGRTLLGFTVKDLGRQSGELTRLQVGDWLALRGPFGTTFPRARAGERLVLVSGGIGSTPLHMAAREARLKLGSKVRIDAIMGFKNQAESHYIERMESVCDSLTITTDDGSLGISGFPTIPLADLLVECSTDTTRVLTCGPEPMMKPVLQMARDAGIECWAAMERYLPCSVAVCGLCMVGDRLTCTQGPVMEGEWLLEQDDFGSAHHH